MPLLKDLAYLLPKKGSALDLACGTGRNALFLAQRGLDVVGMDRSAEALQEAADSAAEARLKVHWQQEDLETVHLSSAGFDVVTCFYYRDPRLYPQIVSTLKTGGLLFYETYTRGQVYFPTGPRNPVFLLDHGELLSAFDGLRVLFYRETFLENAVAGLVARKGYQSNPT